MIAPQAEPVQPVPVTLQVTAVLLVPVTVALNCWCPSATTCIVDGEIFTTTGGTIVTVAVLNLLGSATEVTFTVTCAGFGTVPGAV